jgi:uncharacterized protein
LEIGPTFLILSAMVRLIVAVGIVLVGGMLVIPAVLLAVLGGASREDADWQSRVLWRYQRNGRWGVWRSPRAIFVWVFVQFKMRLDPMFGELRETLNSEPHTALDIGCGYGVVACALLEWHPNLKIFAIDPDESRVAAAKSALGERGIAFVASAPDFEGPESPVMVDAVLILDVIHFIPNEGVALTLRRVHDRLGENGQLILRSIIPPAESGSIWWRVAKIRRRLLGGSVFHRSVEQIKEMIDQAGFDLQTSQISGNNPELCWFIARKRRSDA